MIKSKHLVLLFCLFTRSLMAADLMDVYQQSLENDPIFKAAYSTYMANTEVLPQALAALYPQLSATGGVSGNNYTVTAGGIKLDSNYSTTQWQLNASQALFNYQAWAQVQQAKAEVKSSLASFNNSAQDLILRTSKAYFEVLFAKDTLNFAEAKLRANKRQLDQAKERFNVGLDAITSVYEAKAAYDQSIATVIMAKNNQINRNEDLRKLTNHTYEHLASLKNHEIPLIKPEPNDVNEWVHTGLKQNYRLFAAKYDLQSSRENIKVQQAGNWPVFSLQGNTGQTHNEVGGSGSFFVPTKQAQSSVGIAMTFPFYQGGLVESKTRQAQYQYQTSSEQLEQIYREITVNSTIAFNTIIDGISKVKADKQTVISQRNSLDSTEAQFQVGTRTMVDVTTAQQRLFEAQEQLARDQYNLINAMLQLKYLAGTLNVNDIEEINAWLATTRINSFPKPCPQKKNPRRN